MSWDSKCGKKVGYESLGKFPGAPYWTDCKYFQTGSLFKKKEKKKEKKGIRTPELKQVFLKEHNQIVFSGQSLPSILFVMWQISLKNYLA